MDIQVNENGHYRKELKYCIIFLEIIHNKRGDVYGK